MLYHSYIVKRGDDLFKIAKKIGFNNPGPIRYFPPNNALFARRGNQGHLILPTDEVLIPWQLNSIQRVIATSKHLIKEIRKDEKKLIRQELKNKKELDDFLKKIDAINFLAGIGVSIGGLAANGVKGVTMSSDEIISWLVNDRVKMAADVASTFVIDAPTSPKTDFSFYVRHGLGPWNPSFWTSVMVAIKERDIDIYLYGTDALHRKNVNRIVRQFKADIARLQKRINELEQQKAMDFYRRRI